MIETLLFHIISIFHGWVIEHFGGGRLNDLGWSEIFGLTIVTLVRALG